jgi:hypothetical protein
MITKSVIHHIIKVLFILMFRSLSLTKLPIGLSSWVKIHRNGNTMKIVLLEEFIVKGHKNLRSTHISTIEFTTDSQLTLRGTCILGMDSPIGCLNLKDTTKQLLRGDNKFLIRIKSGDKIDEFFGYGHPNLTLTHPHDIVFRKSTYICGRTIMIGCSKAAVNIDKGIVKFLQNPLNQAVIQIYLIQED